MRNGVRICAAASLGAAFLLFSPASAWGVCREETERGPGAALENREAEEISPDGMAVWQEAQEKQRRLTEIEADLEGCWSVTVLGLEAGESFSGTACFENLGTEEMTGKISLTEGQRNKEYLFQDSRILERQEEGERETVLEPEKWRELTEGLADRTTYDLDYVKSLRIVSREDGSRELSYELSREQAAQWAEPVLRQALSEKGLSLPEGSGWLTLDRVTGDLTVNDGGYMTVDRLRASGFAASGSLKAGLEFEISIVYK